MTTLSPVRTMDNSPLRNLSLDQSNEQTATLGEGFAQSQQSLDLLAERCQRWIAAVRNDHQVVSVAGDSPLSVGNHLGLDDFTPAQRFQLCVDRCLESGTTQQTRLCAFLPNGNARWWQLEVHPSTNETVLVLGEDVTEGVQSQERLERLSTRARQLLDLLLLDKPHKEIERILNISLRSISRVRAELNATLGTTSLVQMAKMVELADQLHQEDDAAACASGAPESSNESTNPNTDSANPG